MPEERAMTRKQQSTDKKINEKGNDR